jgi:hypothetical protein
MGKNGQELREGENRLDKTERGIDEKKD